MMNLQQVRKDNKLFRPYFTDKDKTQALEAYYDYDQVDGKRMKELLKQWADSLITDNPIDYKMDVHIQFYGKDFLPRKAHVRSIQHDSQIAKRRFRRNKKLFLKKSVIKGAYPMAMAWDLTEPQSLLDSIGFQYDSKI